MLSVNKLHLHATKYNVGSEEADTKEHVITITKMGKTKLWCYSQGGANSWE